MTKGEGIEIKAKELHPIAKFFTMVGKKHGKKVIELTRYCMYLATPQVRDPDIKEPLVLLDEETFRILRSDPIFGFAPRLAMEGAAQLYGEDVLKGRANVEVTIGAASEIAVVNEDKSGHVEIIRKKDLGMDNPDIFDLTERIIDMEVDIPVTESQRELKKDKIPKPKWEECKPNSKES